MRKQKQRVVLEQLLVEDYAAEGKSLARIEGKVIFIEGAVPGDVVDVQLSKSKKDWADCMSVKMSANRLRTNPVGVTPNMVMELPH